MQPVQQSTAPQVKQTETSSSLGFVGDIAQSTLDGIKAVAAPGFNAASSLFGSATRACYWLAEQSWQSLYGAAVSFGETEIGKQLTQSWNSLRESAPSLDKLGARLEEISKTLIGLSPGSAEYIELQKQKAETLTLYSEKIKENKTALHDMQTSHLTLLEDRVQKLKSEGLSTEEIEKQMAPLQEARAKMLESQKKILSELEAMQKRLDEDRQQMQHGLTEEEKSARDLCRRKGISEDRSVGESRDALRQHCDDDHCEASGIVARARKMLHQGDHQACEQCLTELSSTLCERKEERKKEVEEHQGLRNSSYASLGVTNQELSGAFDSIDNYLKKTIENFRGYLDTFSKAMEETFRDLYKSTADFNRESINLLRMTNSAYYGGAGGSSLTLGLFDGPYAVSVLSYIEQHQKLEKLAKKMTFLAPPPTLEEKEEYRKMA